MPEPDHVADAAPDPGSEVADDGPRTIQSPAPLTADERRRVWQWALAPVPITALLLLPFAIFGRATASTVLGGAIVYGGLLALATGFVGYDRVQNRQCPGCRERNESGAARCASCGYDLDARPRFACPERHRVHLDPGLCECGRRLQPLRTAGGIGREIAVILRIGAWLLAFLIGMGLLFQFTGG